MLWLAVALFVCNQTRGMEANWRPSAPKPLARDYVALAYDVARERVVLFGGYDGSEPPLADTWEWDGSTWKQRNPAQSPPGRIDHALAYDEARKRVVLFGGNGSVSVADTLGDTWEWDGIRWTQ